MLTPGSPIADEVTGGGEGLGSRIMSPSGGLMLPFLNRPRNDPRREIESDDRVEASRELHVSQHAELMRREPQTSRNAELMRRRRAAFRPIEQRWDHKNPCKHCGHVWLESSKAGLRN